MTGTLQPPLAPPAPFWYPKVLHVKTAWGAAWDARIISSSSPFSCVCSVLRLIILPTPKSHTQHSADSWGFYSWVTTTPECMYLFSSTFFFLSAQQIGTFHLCPLWFFTFLPSHSWSAAAILTSGMESRERRWKQGRKQSLCFYNQSGPEATWPR